VTTASALARLSEPKLRAWILARMRGEQESPPVAEGRLESPDDYLRLVHQQSQDAKFRARLEKAAVAALREAAAGELRRGPDARALKYLAALANSLDLGDAGAVLQEIAERGAFGGHDGGIDPGAEDLVLFALAGLQAPGVLWSGWYTLWQREIPRLWPVVTAGLRLSDPQRALAILPKAVERGESQASFPLGEVLWAFATYDGYQAGEVARALAGLTRESRERSREALKALGAEPQELDAWVPLPGRDRGPDRPLWARRNAGITHPPRFTEAPACP
jgi:hypothetical protein